MHTTKKRIRSDGWTPVRRTAFLGALRKTGKVGDACVWAGMSSAGAYALAKRDPDFAAAWDAALAARDVDHWGAGPQRTDLLDDTALIRRLRAASAKLNARPRGIVAQQNTRRA